MILMYGYGIIETLIVVAGVYLVMGVILVAFAEPIYNRATNSSIPIFTKGLFARAIISYYNVKTRGFNAGWSHWGYCLGFNAGMSITVALVIAFGAALIAIALALIATAIFLWILVVALGD